MIAKRSQSSSHSSILEIKIMQYSENQRNRVELMRNRIDRNSIKAERQRGHRWRCELPVCCEDDGALEISLQSADAVPEESLGARVHSSGRLVEE